VNGWLECAVNTYPFMKKFFLLLVLGAFSAGQFAGAQDFPQQPVPRSTCVFRNRRKNHVIQDYPDPAFYIF